MKTLVVLAVLGMCSASSWQANNHYQSHGGYAAPHYQPKWMGPLASSVPAGVDGTVTPVSDTYEVSAARNAFFKEYNAQLARVGGHGHHTPAYHHSAPAVHHAVSAPAVHHSVSPVHHSVGAPAVHHASHAYGAAPAPVRDTPAVAAAKSEFFRLFNQQAAAAAAAPDHHAHRHYY